MTRDRGNKAGVCDFLWKIESRWRLEYCPDTLPEKFVRMGPRSNLSMSIDMYAKRCLNEGIPDHVRDEIEWNRNAKRNQPVGPNPSTSRDDS